MKKEKEKEKEINQTSNQVFHLNIFKSGGIIQSMTLWELSCVYKWNGRFIWRYIRNTRFAINWENVKTKNVPVSWHNIIFLLSHVLLWHFCDVDHSWWCSAGRVEVEEGWCWCCKLNLWNTRKVLKAFPNTRGTVLYTPFRHHCPWMSVVMSHMW